MIALMKVSKLPIPANDNYQGFHEQMAKYHLESFVDYLKNLSPNKAKEFTNEFNNFVLD